MTGNYLDRDYLAAIRLALVGADSDKTAVRVTQMIVDMSGEMDEERTEPTRILLDAIKEAGGRFTT